MGKYTRAAKKSQNFGKVLNNPPVAQLERVSIAQPIIDIEEELQETPLVDKKENMMYLEAKFAAIWIKKKNMPKTKINNFEMEIENLNEEVIRLKKEMAELQENYKIKFTAQEALIEEQKKQLTEERALVEKLLIKCRLLHNAVQDSKGKIRVFGRVRDRTPQEVEQEKM